MDLNMVRSVIVRNVVPDLLLPSGSLGAVLILSLRRTSPFYA